MKKTRFHNKYKLIILGVIILLTGCFGLIYFFYRQSPARGEESGDMVAGVSAGALSNTSFIKTYHLRDTTHGYGLFPTKDGGYLVTGDTIAGGGMAAPYPYIVKTDAKGGKVWSRDFSSQSGALGYLSNRHLGRLAVETSDGSFVTASDVIDFVDENLKEIYGDVLLTKLNKNGAQLWSLMLGDHNIDRPRQIWALPNGEVMLLARFLKTGYSSEITDGIPEYSVFIKIDKNGKVQFSKKMEWNATGAERLVDGGFIVLANIAVILPKPAENIVGPEVVPHPLPTMIKLDSDLNIVWAKSMEMIPTEMNSPTSYAGGVMTVGKTIIREAGGDFRVIQAAPDGGFVAFGYDNLILTQGMSSGGAINISDKDVSLRPLVAVKVGANGNYQWAKKLTVNLVSGGSANDFHVVRTADGNFVIMKDVAHDALGVLAAASAVNIGLIKTDADLNPLWVKQYSVERSVEGYGLWPTVDKGVVVAGSMQTTKMHYVMGTSEPYTEAALIKVDVNGDVGGCAAVTTHTGATLEDQSSYLVMQDMKVMGSENLTLKINKKVKEKVNNAKSAARDICKYKKSNVTPIYSLLTSSDGSSPTASGQTVVPPTAKTWAVINYENAKEVAVVGEKNQVIHAELLPILNQVYNSQVKMKDSMASMWLAYVFPRPVTRADVEVIQKNLEGLGYKITGSEGGDLWVSKIGLTLHLEFAIQNSMMGKLEVRF